MRLSKALHEILCYKRYALTQKPIFLFQASKREKKGNPT